MTRFSGLAVPLLFLVAGLAGLGHRGLTWDEPESILAGRRNLEILDAGGPGTAGWPWHEFPGYQFAVDTARVAFASAARPLVGGPECAGVPIRGVHLFHLILAAASLFLVHGIAAGISGSRRIGVLAALALAATPKFVAHSQSNPKDLPALFAFALFLWALTRARRLRGFAGAGLALGLALATHVLAVLLVPIAALWTVLAPSDPPVRPWRRRLAAVPVVCATAAATTVALWPWLWAEPWTRAAFVVRRVLDFRLPFAVLYLGRVYPDADPPFHYFTVSLLVATPVAFTLAALLGAFSGLRRGRPAPLRRLTILALLWAGVPMAAEVFTGARYDGVRHLLVVLPAFALLAGIGLDRIMALAAERRRAARAALAVAAAAFLWLLVDLARYHPYEDAYLNAPVRRTLALLDLRPEEVFELECWGAAYREGAEWLDARAEAGAVVHVPLAAWCAEPWLRPGPDGPRLTDEPPRPGDRTPRYLMTMTRSAFYLPEVRRIRAENRPIHTIGRLGATLLEIYRY